MAVVGTGRAGSSLVAALAAAGWPVAGVVGRTEASAALAAARLGVPHLGASVRPSTEFHVTPWVLLAVRDRDLPALAVLLAMNGAWAERVVLHVSGALASDVLEPLARAGADVGSLHPLLSLRGAEGAADALAGGQFFGEGTPAAEEAGARLAGALGATWRRLDPALKPLYHACATIAGNLAPALCAASARVLREAGLEGMEGPLAQLGRSGLDGIAAGGAEGLTGPIARGDAETLRENVRALGALSREDDLRAAHRAASRLALDELRRAGLLDAEQARALASVLDEGFR